MTWPGRGAAGGEAGAVACGGWGEDGGASGGSADPGGVELPRGNCGGGDGGFDWLDSGEPGTGCSGAGCRLVCCSSSCNVGSGGNGPGQMSPGSGVNAGTSTSWPMTRRMFSLSPAGRFGLVPEV